MNKRFQILTYTWYKYKGDPPKQILFILYMFKLQSPSKYSLFATIHLSRLFSTAQKFLNLLILMSFSASAFFCFTSSTLAKLFSFGKNKIKKSLRARSGEWGEGEPQGLCLFWSKTAEHSEQCGQVCLLFTHHEMGKCIGSLNKNLLKLNAASHNHPSWYTETDGFLEHSLNGGSLYYKGPTLQKLIPGFSFGPPSYNCDVIL